MDHSLLISKLNYWIFICVMMIGLWAMISKQNLIKKVMGMGIFQSAIILFYVSIAAKDAGTNIPIYPHDLIHPHHEVHQETHTAHHIEHPEDQTHHEHDKKEESSQLDSHHLQSDQHEPDHSELHPKIADKVDPNAFNNPLPHVLMLTAIVVGVATLGVALSLVQRIYRSYGSIEENEILETIAKESTDNEMTIESASNANTKPSGSNA